jgi:aminoglycoside phosphotransferase (APT) family kinase protein
VFRFPRNAERRALFACELKLLARIAGASPVAVPQYAHVAPRAAFGGYAMIHGAPLTGAAFHALGRPRQEAVLDQIAALLRLIHVTPPGVIAGARGRIAHGWTADRFARRYRERRRARIAQAVSAALLGRIDSFFEAYERRPPWPSRVVVHGDLTADHMLLAPGAEALAGVIDFADAELDDPAHDFTYLWAFGDWAPAHAAQRYGAADAGLVERSRWSWARYRIDQLRWAADGHIGAHEVPSEAEMTALFGALGV